MLNEAAFQREVSYAFLCEMGNEENGSKEDAMKKKDLEKAVRAKGAVFLGPGGGHDRWMSKNGHKFVIPRHREIPPGTAQAILKQADM